MVMIIIIVACVSFFIGWAFGFAVGHYEGKEDGYMEFLDEVQEAKAAEEKAAKGAPQ